jgi:hypothetical protein
MQSEMYATALFFRHQVHSWTADLPIGWQRLAFLGGNDTAASE